MHPYGKDYEEPILRFVKVSKYFGTKKVLEDINFDIRKGELYGLIGRSGAGKTTLLNTLIGYYPTTTGKIFYKGKDISKNLMEIRKIFGFTTQDVCLYDELNAIDNMEYFGKMYGLSNEEIVKKTKNLLKMVELWESRDIIAKNLSGGMKRRLDMAISLIHDPEILILDEPTTGLDPVLRKEIWKIIRKINQEGVTIIMSSHLLDEMELLCNRVAMIKSGKLLIKGTPAQLKTFYSRNQEVKLESFPGHYKKILEELKKRQIPLFYPRHEGAKLIFYTPSTGQTLKTLPDILLQINEKLRDISIEKPNLSEVFEALSRYNIK